MAVLKEAGVAASDAAATLQEAMGAGSTSNTGSTPPSPDNAAAPTTAAAPAAAEGRGDAVGTDDLPHLSALTKLVVRDAMVMATNEGRVGGYEDLFHHSMQVPGHASTHTRV
jgi:hypothetical protein